MTTPAAVAQDTARVTYLNPTGYVQQVERTLTPRLSTVAGKVAGLLDNGNDTSSYFFAALAEALETEYAVNHVLLRTKFTSTRPADPSLIAEISEGADFLISGVAL